ncbi:hypothetical protein TREES_T100014554 [Tupaia chinensis]|uniref:Uncharacterized protein n=1 Tax=Tupaia chinensis TaxID=246437 RepID=L9LC29_TUPCH|nr:hypothetical protein TREES_T100014554 [Tupaia chinensis]
MGPLADTAGAVAAGRPPEETVLLLWRSSSGAYWIVLSCVTHNGPYRLGAGGPPPTAAPARIRVAVPSVYSDPLPGLLPRRAQGSAWCRTGAMASPKNRQGGHLATTMQPGLGAPALHRRAFSCSGSARWLEDTVVLAVPVGPPLSEVPAGIDTRGPPNYLSGLTFALSL